MVMIICVNIVKHIYYFIYAIDICFSVVRNTHYIIAPVPYRLNIVNLPLTALFKKNGYYIDNIYRACTKSACWEGALSQ